MTGESFRNLYLWSPGAELDACQTRGTACLPYPFVGPAEQTRRLRVVGATGRRRTGAQCGCHVSRRLGAAAGETHRDSQDAT